MTSLSNTIVYWAQYPLHIFRMNINRQKLFWHRSIYWYWNWLHRLMVCSCELCHWRAINFDWQFHLMNCSYIRCAANFPSVHSNWRPFRVDSLANRRDMYAKSIFDIFSILLWAHNQVGNEQYWIWRIVSYIEVNWIPVERMNWTGRPFRRIFEIEQMPTNAEWYEFSDVILIFRHWITCVTCHHANQGNKYRVSSTFWISISLHSHCVCMCVCVFCVGENVILVYRFIAYLPSSTAVRITFVFEIRNILHHPFVYLT